MKRFGLFGVFVVSSVCILIILASHQLSNYGLRHEPDFRRNIQSFADETCINCNVNASLPSMKDVVAQQAAMINEEIFGYRFPQDKELSDFTLSTGGQPLRNIIITTWRSGSTFLGEIINTVPGNYYHYEPLLDYDIIQIRGAPFADSALQNLKNLLKCDYSDMQHYLEYGKNHIYLFTHNTRLWDQCQSYPQYCWNETFLNEMCKVFPFQSMKIVRLRLNVAEELLKDETLNVKILLLVRDPRGILQSRKHREWCPGKPDCDQPSILCSDMVSDYKAAQRLIKLYPDTFKVIRYEDFSLDPYAGVNELFDFFQLYVHPRVKDFLDSHTTTNVGGVSSTFRNSKSAPFHWRLDLNYSEVQNIENECKDAMKKWGYVKSYNESSLKDLNPLTEYTLN